RSARMTARMMLASALFAAAILVGCATAPSDERISADASAMIKASFKARGQAGLDRLDQDDTQRLCSQAAGKTPPKDIAERIEKQNLATIQYPADGKLIG